MIQFIQKHVVSCATWPRVALLTFCFMLCTQGFTWRSQKLGPLPIPDTRMFYTPTELKELYSEWGPAKRELYAITQLTLDIAFPLVYVLLFGAIVSKVFVARWPTLLPILAGFADVMENVAVAFLAFTFDGNESSITWLATLFTCLKTFLILCTALAMGYGGWKGWQR